jgi:hypothetical protein
MDGRLGDDERGGKRGSKGQGSEENPAKDGKLHVDECS